MKQQNLGLLVLTGLLASCGAPDRSSTAAQTPQSETSATYLGTTVEIDPSILGFDKRLEILAAKKKGQNPNTLMKTEQGDIEFFKREIIVKVTDTTAFNKFLKKYNGVVLSDGRLPALRLSGAEKGNQLREVPQGVFQLVQIDAPVTSMDSIVKKLNQLGLKGQVRFPDQESANLYYASLDARDEFGLSTEANYAMREAASGNDQEQMVNGTRITPNNSPDTYWAFAKTGVVQAWQEFGVTGYLPDIGIIDIGFKPNDYELTGFDPVSNTNVSYKGTIANQQFDFPEGDTDVTSYDGDPDGNNATWHGQQVAQVALGASNNRYGASGVAPGAWPYLYRLGRGIGNLLSYYDAGRAVDMATASGVDVINMSFGALTPGGVGVPNTYLGAALERSKGAGVINVASAGNDGRYQYASQYPWYLYPVPAVWSSVIAVGSTTSSDSRSSFSNYGAFVDIWAPGEFLPTASRPELSCYTASQSFCANYQAISTFSGTSAAAPFVAGAIALMRDANFSLNANDVVSILQSTSNRATPDSDVNGVGRINVYEAVKKAKTYRR